MIKLNKILKENIERDLVLLRKQFGEEMGKGGILHGRGKGQYFDNIKLIKRIQKEIPISKYPKILYRGISITPGSLKYDAIKRADWIYRNDKEFQNRIKSDNEDFVNLKNTQTFRNKPIINWAKGIRSWTTRFSSAKYYTDGELGIIFIWENPNRDNIYLFSNDTKKYGGYLAGLDTDEYIAEYKNNSIKEIELYGKQNPIWKIKI